MGRGSSKLSGGGGGGAVVNKQPEATVASILGVGNPVFQADDGNVDATQLREMAVASDELIYALNDKDSFTLDTWTNGNVKYTYNEASDSFESRSDGRVTFGLSAEDVYDRVQNALDNGSIRGIGVDAGDLSRFWWK